MASLGSILLWWFLSLVLSFATLPLSSRIFRFLPDKGVGLSRILGLALTSYLAWVLGFAYNSAGTSFVALAAIAGASFWVYQNDKTGIRSILETQAPLIMIYEALFFFLLFAWSLLRMHKPDIVDQEKFMDFAFFNALIRAEHFPPFDPWLAAPKNWLNYYYFGYFSFAQFARMTFLDPAVCYNLVIAFVFALSGQIIVSIGYNLTSALWPGFAALGLLQVFGNLHGGLQAFSGNPGFDWWAPTRMIKDVVKDGHYLNSWWWSADPAVLAANQLGPDAAKDGLISEFPNFSFIHGDMHPHFTAIPFVLMTLAFGLNLLKNEDRDPLNVFEASPARNARALTLAGLAFCLGLLFMTNTWDVPAYGLALSLILLSQQHQLARLSRQSWVKSWLLPSLSMLVGIFVVAILFIAFFESPAKLFDSSKPGWQKFGFGMAFARTGMHDTLIFWGSFLVVLLPFVGTRIWLWSSALAGTFKPEPAKPLASPSSKSGRKCAECGSKLRPGKLFCAQCGHKNVEEESAPESLASESFDFKIGQAPEFVANFLKLFSQPAVALRDTRVAVASAVLGLLGLVLLVLAPTTALFLGLAFFAGMLLAARQDKPEASFALALILVASLLVAGVEWFYLRDVFEGNPSLTRMNTVFKFYFQAWILFAVASPYALYWTYKAVTHRLGAAGSMIFIVPVMVAFLLAGAYPIGAIRSVTADFDSQNRQPTLDGSDWLKRDYPLDHDMILWLRQNIKGKAVIAEAVGGAYTRFARVSAYTGLASVCGWGNHESQWRAYKKDAWPTKEEADVNTLYETMNPDEAKALIAKYGIQYVFVGSLERSKFSPDQLSKFGSFMDVLKGDPAATIVYKTRS
jgi:uncharacterized membrane protein